MKTEPLLIPALRGSFGDWIYYSCLMPVSEVGSRARFAEEIHPDRALSKLIQRSLEGVRARHIANYLTFTKERFFNSLVLATYGGSPEWLEIGDFKSTTRPELVKQVSQSAMDAMGFLRLTGTEKIFAIDGQHRLAGIKKALEDGQDLSSEQVPVILVGHKKSAAGLERTRRLFTTLNKTAVPVRKGDIIALDEDDAMAIIVRRLVETNASFRDPKIAVIASQNIPVSNRACLTTISSLYDTLPSDSVPIGRYDLIGPRTKSWTISKTCRRAIFLRWVELSNLSEISLKPRIQLLLLRNSEGRTEATFFFDRSGWRYLPAQSSNSHPPETSICPKQSHC
jgi:DNA sulfur modification protein DndB